MKKVLCLTLLVAMLVSGFPLGISANPVVADWLRIRQDSTVTRGTETFEGFSEGQLAADNEIGISSYLNMTGTVRKENGFVPNKYLQAYTTATPPGVTPAYPAQKTALRFLEKAVNPISGNAEVSFRTMLPTSAAASSTRFLVCRGASGDIYNIFADYDANGACKLKQSGGTSYITLTTGKWIDVKIIIKNNLTYTTAYTFIDGRLLDANGFTNSNAANIADSKLVIDWIGFDNPIFNSADNHAKFDDLRVVSGYFLPVAANAAIVKSGYNLTANYSYFSPDISGTYAQEGVAKYEWYVSDMQTGENAAKIEGASGKTYTVPAGNEEKFYSCRITPVDINGIEGIPVLCPSDSISLDSEMGKEIYCDNGDPAPAFVYQGMGTALTSSLAGYYGTQSSYLSNSSVGDYVKWTPQNVSAGYYEVYINIMNQFGNAAVNPMKDALIDITAGGKTTPSYRDFRYVSGWQRLGTFQFNGDGTENIKMTKMFKEKTSDPIFRYDAVKLKKVPAPKVQVVQPVVQYNGIDLSKSGLVGGNLTITTNAVCYPAKSMIFQTALYFENKLIDINLQTMSISGSQSVTQNISVPDPCAGYYIKTFVWDEQMQPIYEGGLMTLKGYFGLGGFRTDMPSYQGDVDYTQGRGDMDIGNINDTTYFYPDYSNSLEFNMRGGLPNTIAKLESGKPLSIGYIGGSITEQNGWRPRTTAYFKRMYPNSTITEIAAGLSGTGSELGAARLYTDVLSKNPDLIFIEFAVNDYGRNSDIIKKSMEGMVRKAWTQNPNIDVCFVYTVMASFKDYYLPESVGSMPSSVAAQDEVAQYYNIPSIHFGYKVMDLASSGKLLFQGSSEPPETILFSSDGIHPLPKGDQIYAGAVARSYQKMLSQGGWVQTHHQKPAPMYADNFEYANLYDINEAEMLSGSWSKILTSSVYSNLSKCFTYLYKSGTEGDTLHFSFDGTGVGIFDMGGPESGVVEIFVDGVSKGVIDRFTSANDHYRQEYFVISGLSPDVHNAEIKLVKRNDVTQNKRNIISRKDLYDANPSAYAPNIVYLGKLIVLGTLK